MLPPEGDALVKWAKEAHRLLGTRIEKGQSITSPNDKAAASLVCDLKWRQNALDNIIMAASMWDASNLAALGLRLCVRMPAEFLNDELYQLASNHDIGGRNTLIAKIGDVPITGYDKEKALRQLFPLIQEAATRALDDHEYAYRTWFAVA